MFCTPEAKSNGPRGLILCQRHAPAASPLTSLSQTPRPEDCHSQPGQKVESSDGKARRLNREARLHIPPPRVMTASGLHVRLRRGTAQGNSLNTAETSAAPGELAILSDISCRY